MKIFLRLLLLMALITAVARPAFAGELGSLKVLYVGEKGSERERAFSALLLTNVAAIEVANRKGFNPATAASYDVVLLDWPQEMEVITKPHWGADLVCPLGARNEWTRPTVLLGSAGLNVAVSWQTKGGNGCTCMDPLAYGLRDHEIFEKPFEIDRTKMVSIPTPEDFQGEIKERTIQVLPLVDDITAKWKMGWCSYAYDFLKNPDVEYFCGGVNHKTPTAAGALAAGESSSLWL